GGVVMEGRDIGTAVLPQAEFKFFLTASPEERAKRRLHDLLAKGYNLEQQQVIKEIIERDRLDSERATDPLKPAEGAKVIDSSLLSADQVVNLITSTVSGEGTG
ncbi:MAG: cytidylate kinase, partial [Peptococcaceae bacterium]